LQSNPLICVVLIGRSPLRRMVTLIWVVKEPFCLPWFMELTGGSLLPAVVSLLLTGDGLL
jgi:hypothetical protein